MSDTEIMNIVDTGELSHPEWEQTMADLISDLGLYRAMLWVAWQHANDTDRSRIAYLRDEATRVTEYGYMLGSIERRRLHHAAHLLTGRVALRMHGAVSGGHQNLTGMIDLDLVLNSRRFAGELKQRTYIVGTLTSPPLDRLLRVSMISLLIAIDDDNIKSAATQVLSIMHQVCHFDAVSASEIVDMVAACLLPPV